MLSCHRWIPIPLSASGPCLDKEKHSIQSVTLCGRSDPSFNTKYIQDSFSFHPNVNTQSGHTRSGAAEFFFFFLRNPTRSDQRLRRVGVLRGRNGSDLQEPTTRWRCHQKMSTTPEGTWTVATFGWKRLYLFILEHLCEKRQILFTLYVWQLYWSNVLTSRGILYLFSFVLWFIFNMYLK